MDDARLTALLETEREALARACDAPTASQALMRVRLRARRRASRRAATIVDVVSTLVLGAMAVALLATMWATGVPSSPSAATLRLVTAALLLSLGALAAGLRAMRTAKSLR